MRLHWFKNLSSGIKNEIELWSVLSLYFVYGTMNAQDYIHNELQPDLYYVSIWFFTQSENWGIYYLRGVPSLYKNSQANSKDIALLLTKLRENILMFNECYNLNVKQYTSHMEKTRWSTVFLDVPMTTICSLSNFHLNVHKKDWLVLKNTLCQDRVVKEFDISSDVFGSHNQMKQTTWILFCG